MNANPPAARNGPRLVRRGNSNIGRRRERGIRTSDQPVLASQDDDLAVYIKYESESDDMDASPQLRSDVPASHHHLSAQSVAACSRARHAGCHR